MYGEAKLNSVRGHRTPLASMERKRREKNERKSVKRPLKTAFMYVIFVKSHGQAE